MFMQISICRFGVFCFPRDIIRTIKYSHNNRTFGCADNQGPTVL